MGARYFVRHKRTMIKSIVLALMITEAVVVLLRRDSHFRVTRSLRPVFLIDNYYFGGVRRVIRQTIQSLHSFVEMLILLMFFLIFFSISAFYLFASVPNYEQFSTIWNSFISLYILLTTSKYLFSLIYLNFSINSLWSAVFQTSWCLPTNKARHMCSFLYSSWRWICTFCWIL